MDIPVRIGKTIDVEYMTREVFDTLREPGVFMVPVGQAVEMLADAELSSGTASPRARRAYLQLAKQLRGTLAAIKH